MPQSVERLFPESERQKIEKAVQEAEKRTSGEIVPYVVGESDDYDETLWRAGVLFGTIGLLVFVLIRRFSTAWMPADLGEVALVTFAGIVIGIVLARYVPTLRRVLAGNALTERRVAQRAAEAFIAEEIFATRERTGILIFLSLFERKVLVVGDSGINTKVQQSEWNTIVHTIIEAIRAGKPADGLVQAIEQCGFLLQRAGVQIRPDDSNEIDNSLRTGPSP